MVSQAALNQDISSFIEGTQALLEELNERAKQGISAYPAKGKRVMLAGTPSPMGNAKVHHVVETSGMRIVADESCTGLRYFRDLVDETPTDMESMINAVADRYFAIDCSCFSPNRERLDHIVQTVKEYQVQGVVQNVLAFCHGYNVEAKAVENVLRKIFIPSIKIVTDYSDEDAEQLRVRLESFRELL